MTIVEAQNLTATSIPLFDLGISVPSSSNLALTSPERSPEDVFSSPFLRLAIENNQLRIRINGHVPTKGESLTFVSLDAINQRRKRLRITLRSPDGSLWDVGIDNSGNIRSKKR